MAGRVARSFLRDITQGITLLLMAWMYLTPIIYPESIVPRTFPRIHQLQSLHFTGTQLPSHLSRRRRARLAWPRLLHRVCLLIFIFGYWWFARTRKELRRRRLGPQKGTKSAQKTSGLLLIEDTSYFVLFVPFCGMIFFPVFGRGIHEQSKTSLLD
jgi:hypothetical protein